jgi:hypothetical protein
MATTRREVMAAGGALLAATGVANLAQAQQVPPPRSPAEVPGMPSGTIMTKEFVAMVGRLAYVWGWPMVNQINRRASFAQVPEPGRLGGVLPVAPTGYVAMLTDYIAPDQHFVTCPNQDTVYGAGFQSLDKTPVIVQVPDFGTRFFTYQIVDHRTDSFASIGRQYDTKPGHYLLVGPNWKGSVPAGINAVMRSSTDLCAVFPRVFQDDTPEDKIAIQRVLNQIMVYPLTEFTGEMKTKDWSKAPSSPAPAGAGSGETKWVLPEKFFDQFLEVLQSVPPLPGEEALYGLFRAMVDAAAKDPQVKAALTQIAIAAENKLIAPLFEFRNNGRPVGKGWTSPPNGARWGLSKREELFSCRVSNLAQTPTVNGRLMKTSGALLHPRMK